MSLIIFLLSLLTIGACLYLPKIASADDLYNSYSNLRQGELQNKISDWKKNQDEVNRLSDLQSKVLGVLDEKKQELFQKSKELAVSSIEAIIAYIEDTKLKIQANANADETIKSNIVAILDGYISYLEAKKDEVEAATTMNELRKITAEVRTYWQTNRGQVRSLVARSTQPRFNCSFGGIETMFSQAETKIQSLKSTGIDTTAAEEYLAGARTLIDKAKVECQQAQDLFNANTTSFSERSFGEAVTHLRRDAQYLKEASAKMRLAIQAIKGQLVSSHPTRSPRPTLIPKPTRVVPTVILPTFFTPTEANNGGEHE